MPAPGIPKTISHFENFDSAEEYLQYLASILSNFLREIDWLLSGNLSVDNIKAKSITADRLGVKELSAITANLGEMIAGVITGLLIQTAAPGVYPRIEFSSSDKVLKVYKDPTTHITLDTDITGDPGFHFISPLIDFLFTMAHNTMIFQTFMGSIRVQASDFLHLSAGFTINVDSWSKLFSVAQERTLQSELDNLQAQINNLATRVNALESS